MYKAGTIASDSYSVQPKKKYTGLKIFIALIILVILAYIIIPPLYVPKGGEPSEDWYNTHITADSADEAIKWMYTKKVDKCDIIFS